MPVVRRSKTQKLQQGRDDEMIEAASYNHNPNEVVLSKFYRGVSILHFGQIVMAFKKSGLTVGFLNVIGGPIMAGGLMILLGYAAENQNLGSVTCKRINGNVVIYSFMTLALVALVPQLNNPFGMLWFVSSSSSCFVSMKGYLTGLRDDDDKKFLSETWRLLKDSVISNLCLPRDRTSFGRLCSVSLVAIRQLKLIRGILKIIMLPGSTKHSIAPSLNELSKLTILGGSLVTTASIQDDARNSSKKTFVSLFFLSSYVLGTMAAFGISDESSRLELWTSILFAFCAISLAMDGIHDLLVDDKKSA